MRHVSAAAVARVLVLIACAGCSGRSSLIDRLPRSPTGPSGDQIAGSPRGTIALDRTTPDSGATLTLRDCNPGGLTRLCTDQLNLLVQVQADQDVVTSIRAELWNGRQLCGSSAPDVVTLTSNEPRTIQFSRFLLSDGEGSFCELPAVTTRLTVHLGAFASRDYDRMYTFRMP
jgi:hypothetical protein